jgi:hypothetical protein
LDDFHALLSTAHFAVLTAKEWDTAQAENFTVRREKETCFLFSMCVSFLLFAFD